MKAPLVLLLLAVAAHAAHAASTRRHRRDAEEGLAAAPAEAALDAEVFGADPGERADREKRLLLEHKVQIHNHVKNAVLNLIFGKINSVIDSKSALLGVFERANAAKNLALLGPGTKRPPAGSGIKGILSGVLSSSLGSSSGSSLPSLTGLSGGSSGSSGGAGGSSGGDSTSDFGGGASLGASLGGSIGGGSSSSSSSSSSGYP